MKDDLIYLAQRITTLSNKGIQTLLEIQRWEDHTSFRRAYRFSLASFLKILRVDLLARRFIKGLKCFHHSFAFVDVGYVFFISERGSEEPKVSCS